MLNFIIIVSGSVVCALIKLVRPVLNAVRLRTFSLFGSLIVSGAIVLVEIMLDYLIDRFCFIFRGRTTLYKFGETTSEDNEPKSTYLQCLCVNCMFDLRYSCLLPRELSLF